MASVAGPVSFREDRTNIQFTRSPSAPPHRAQCPPSLSLGRAQSVPADELMNRSTATVLAHMIISAGRSSLDKIREFSPDVIVRTPVVARTSLGASDAFVKSIVQKVREELYAKYPHLALLDKSTGERLG